MRSGRVAASHQIGDRPSLIVGRNDDPPDGQHPYRHRHSQPHVHRGTLDSTPTIPGKLEAGNPAPLPPYERRLRGG